MGIGTKNNTAVGVVPQQQQQAGEKQKDNVINNNSNNNSSSSPQQRSSTVRQQDQQTVSVSSHRRKKKQYAVSTQWERQIADEGAPRDCHSRFCCCATRIGNMFALVTYPDGSPIVIAGPCWPFCMFVTVPLILSISFIVCYFLIIDHRLSVPDWVLIFYVPTVIFVLITLFCVSCRDPGLMERVTDEEAGEGGWFWNEQVGSYRPPGALYCRECGVLIQDYDHLCPWTGTGIGRKNMWAFKIFVVSVNILCYFSVGILIWALLDGLAA